MWGNNSVHGITNCQYYKWCVFKNGPTCDHLSWDPPTDPFHIIYGCHRNRGQVVVRGDRTKQSNVSSSKDPSTRVCAVYSFRVLIRIVSSWSNSKSSYISLCCFLSLRTLCILDVRIVYRMGGFNPCAVYELTKLAGRAGRGG